MIPQGEPDGAAFAIVPAEGFLVEGSIFKGGSMEKVDFFWVK